jgi:hypothetical protein
MTDRGGSRKAAVPAVTFQGRISIEADQIRRKLATELDVSAGKLIERALFALKREVDASVQPAE